MILLHENFFGINGSNVVQNFKYVNAISVGTSFSRWTTNTSGMAFNGWPAYLYAGITGSNPVYSGWAQYAVSGDGLSVRFRQNGTTHVDAYFQGGLVTIRRGLSTTLATYNIPNWSSNTWYYFEMGAVIDDVNGSVQFIVNGQTVISASNLDTRNGALPYVDEVGFEGPNLVTRIYYMTDWYVTDTLGSNPTTNGFLGDIRIFSTIPSSSGDTLNFIPLTGTNVQMVDDGNSPDDNTTFVSASLSGSLDLYNTFQYTGSATQIYGVGVKALARKTDAGSRNIQLTIKSGSNIQRSVTQSVLDSYRYHTAVFETNPNTGGTWALPDANGTQVGYTIL